MGKKLRCYLGMHRWVKKSMPGQDAYLECQNCGKERDKALVAPTGP